MITAINDGEELLYRPLNPVVKSALEEREGDKNYVINRFPFLRVTCLQKLSLNESTKTNQTNNLVSYKDKIGCNKSVIDGFIFEMREDFDSSYSQKIQKIGTELKTLDSITIANPRRVPPPQLTGFTATNGAAAGFFTSAKLEFTCHSLEQLEFLTPFLLHPGNTLFFEWGYSDKNTTMNMPLMSWDDLQQLLDTIVIPTENIDDECDDEVENSFYDELENRIKENNGNYEYIPGIITNFDFSLNDNFGYNVSVDIISISQAQLQVSPETPGGRKQEDEETNDENKKREIKDAETILSEKVAKLEEEKWNYRNGNTNSVLTKSIDTIFKTNDSDKEYFDKVINIPTKRGYEKYIRLRELLPLIGNPINERSALRKYNKYIRSFDKDILIFTNKIPSAKNIPISDQGNLLFSLSDMESGFIPQENTYDTILTDIKISNQINPTEIREVGKNLIGQLGRVVALNSAPIQGGDPNLNVNFLKRVEFQLYKPFKYDINDNGESKGDIRNVYVNYEFFKSLYTSPDANNRDILTSILIKISKATGGFYNDVVAEIYDTKCKKQKSNIINPTNRCIKQDDKRKTYTFKFNQKESLVTNLDFDFALDGLFLDQVYAQSISAQSNDESGKKFSLMLFENQENNIQLTDYRNERVKFLRDSLDGDFKVSKDFNTYDSGSLVSDLYSADPSKFLSVMLVNQQNLENLETYKDPRNLNLVSYDGINVNTDTETYNILLSDDISEKIAVANDEDTGGKSELDLFTEIVSGSIAPLVDSKKDLYFDAMASKEKNDESEDNEGPCSSKFTPIAETEIKIQFPGLGGFQPLEFFKTRGITSVYDNRGEFVIYSVVHTLTRDNWTTELTARFRVKPSEDDGDTD